MADETETGDELLAIQTKGFECILEVGVLVDECIGSENIGKEGCDVGFEVGSSAVDAVDLLCPSGLHITSQDLQEEGELGVAISDGVMCKHFVELTDAMNKLFFVGSERNCRKDDLLLLPMTSHVCGVVAFRSRDPMFIHNGGSGILFN